MSPFAFAFKRFCADNDTQQCRFTLTVRTDQCDLITAVNFGTASFNISTSPKLLLTCFNVATTLPGVLSINKVDLHIRALNIHVLDTVDLIQSLYNALRLRQPCWPWL